MIIQLHQQILLHKRLVTSMCTHCIELLVLGQNWQTRVVLDSKYDGKIGHIMEQRLWPPIGTINKLHQWFCRRQNWRLQTWVFQDASFARDLQDPKSTSGGVLCVFGPQSFVPMSWMCVMSTIKCHLIWLAVFHPTFQTSRFQPGYTCLTTKDEAPVGGTLLERSIWTQKWLDYQKYSGTTTSAGIKKLKVLRLHIPRQTRRFFDAAVDEDTDDSFINKRCHWKRLYARDVLPQNHLHGHDERVGGFCQCSSQRRSELQERHSYSRLRWTIQGLGSSSDQCQKSLGSLTSGTHRTKQKETGTTLEKVNLRQKGGSTCISM